MKVTANLLHEAYGHIDAGNLQSAIDILESLLSFEPMNVEAWEAYMQICVTCEELDCLCERAIQVAEINRTDRESILDYYYFLRQKLRSCGSEFESQKMITIELVDQFSFTLRDQLNLVDCTKSQHGFTWLLGKVIIIPYIILLAIGLNLLSVGNNFGYWILIVLALIIVASMWKTIFPLVENNRKPSVHMPTYPSVCGDEISCHPELIH